MTNIKEAHILFIEGKQVDRYSITCNNWEEMPELKKGRLCHSCTSLGENVYVIGLGKDKTIEKLNLSKLRRGEARWELLELPIRIHKNIVTI